MILQGGTEPTVLQAIHLAGCHWFIKTQTVMRALEEKKGSSDDFQLPCEVICFYLEEEYLLPEEEASGGGHLQVEESNFQVSSGGFATDGCRVMVAVLTARRFCRRWKSPLGFLTGSRGVFRCDCGFSQPANMR